MIGTYRFVLDDKVRLVHGFLDTLAAFKSDETKAAWPACLAINHERSIDNLAEPREIVPELVFIHFARDTAYEDLLRSLLLLPRDRSLGIDLNVWGCSLAKRNEKKREEKELVYSKALASDRETYSFIV